MFRFNEPVVYIPTNKQQQRVHWKPIANRSSCFFCCLRLEKLVPSHWLTLGDRAQPSGCCAAQHRKQDQQQYLYTRRESLIIKYTGTCLWTYCPAFDMPRANKMESRIIWIDLNCCWWMCVSILIEPDFFPIGVLHITAGIAGAASV